MVRKSHLCILVLFITLIFLNGSVVVEANSNTLIFLSAENLTGNWDPADHTNLAQEQLQLQIGDRLVNVDKDNNLIPELAVSWQMIDDYTWEFKLREGVKFHDGTAFTAEDVKATIEHFTDPTKAAAGAFPEKIYGEVVDNYTVRLFTKDGKAGSVIYTLVAYPPMLPVEDVRNPERMRERLIGTGAWKFIKYENDIVYMEANEDYWGGELQLDKFEWHYVPEPDVRMSALLTEAAHIVDRLETELVPRVEASPLAYVDRTLVIEHVWLHFRNNKYPFKDNAELRRALAYAIDREGIHKYIMEGSGDSPKGFISPVQFGFMGEHPDNPKYDPEKAKELLAKAGYPGGEGLPTLELIVPVGFYPKTLEYAQYIAQTAEEVGINIDVQPHETAAWNEKLYNHEEGHMIFCGWLPGTPEPDTVLRQNFRSPGRINAVDDPEIDEVLDREKDIMDFEERRQVLHNDVNEILLRKMPSIPLVCTEVILGVSKKVVGFENNHTARFIIDHNVYLAD